MLEASTGGALKHLADSTRLVGTTATLAVPAAPTGIVAPRGRNALLFKQEQQLAQGGAALGEALEEEEMEQEEEAEGGGG